MDMLDWKNSPTVTLARGAHPKYQTQVTIMATATQLTELHSAFSQAAAANDEVRVELPQNWMLYFKLRASASRVQLAHPALNDWVATLNLSPTHAQKFLDALLQLAQQNGAGEVMLNALADPGPFANVEIVIAKL